MNSIQISGALSCDSVWRTLENGSVLVQFEMLVESKSFFGPYVRIFWYPHRDGDPRELKTGTRVFIVGELRYRREITMLYVAASELLIFAGEGVCETPTRNGAPFFARLEEKSR